MRKVIAQTRGCFGDGQIKGGEERLLWLGERGIGGEFNENVLRFGLGQNDGLIDDLDLIHGTAGVLPDVRAELSKAAIGIGESL